MVARAMRCWMRSRASAFADMFCGIGNFTLPITRSGSVLGMEGNQSLMERAVDQRPPQQRPGGSGQLSGGNLFEVTPESFAAASEPGRTGNARAHARRCGDGAVLPCARRWTKRVPAARGWSYVVQPGRPGAAPHERALASTPGATPARQPASSMFPHTPVAESVRPVWKRPADASATHAELEAHEAAEAAAR